MIYILDKLNEKLLFDENLNPLSFGSITEARVHLITKEKWTDEEIGKHFTFLSDPVEPPIIDNDNVEADREFNFIAHSAIKYLNDYHHPHTTIIITPTYAEVVEGINVVHTNDYLKD